MWKETKTKWFSDTKIPSALLWSVAQGGRDRLLIALWTRKLLSVLSVTRWVNVAPRQVAGFEKTSPLDHGDMQTPWEKTQARGCDPEWKAAYLVEGRSLTHTHFHTQTPNTCVLTPRSSYNLQTIDGWVGLNEQFMKCSAFTGISGPELTSPYH